MCSVEAWSPSKKQELTRKLLGGKGRISACGKQRRAGAPVRAGRLGGGIGGKLRAAAASPGMRGVGPGPSPLGIRGREPGEEPGATWGAGERMLREPSITDPAEKRGQKGQEKGTAGGCEVFRGGGSRDAVGRRGRERRGEPRQGKRTEG